MATKVSPTREEQVAKAKIKALSEGVKVWVLETGDTPRYAVPSASMDGTAYEVIVHNRDADDVSCNCPGNVYRNICKHVGAIMVRLDLEAEMELASARAAEDRDISQELESELAAIG